MATLYLFYGNQNDQTLDFVAPHGLGLDSNPQHRLCAILSISYADGEGNERQLYVGECHFMRKLE
mgnify:CR=1 FL=1